jgi:hypothetical protein
MNDAKVDHQRYNLEFFRSAMTVGDSRRSHFRRMESISLVEAALWLKLGTEIGYFDVADAFEVIVALQDKLSNAWSYLLRSEVLSSETWGKFMFRADGILVPERVFTGDERPDREFENRDSEDLRQIFRGCVLLTSEVIFEPSTMEFVEIIAWEDDEGWREALRGGDVRRLRALLEGFAKHVRYSDELQKYFWNRHAETAPESDVVKMFQRIFDIIGQRMSFKRERVLKRYFHLGGEMAAMVIGEEPGWEAAINSIFVQLIALYHIDDEGEIAKLSKSFLDVAQKAAVRSTWETCFG